MMLTTSDVAITVVRTDGRLLIAAKARAMLM